MRILHIISVVLCLSSIQGYPTRPLDDIARNLTWDEAWDGDEMTRKKVVPKSVFIAPDFGSPRCPSGHERDSMGKCIKLHSLDADSQLNFLFEKILAGLPPSDVDTPDPVRLNVPIDHTESVDDRVNLALVFTKDQNEDDIAVVVSPTNGSFSPEKLSLHKDVEQPGTKFVYRPRGSHNNHGGGHHHNHHNHHNNPGGGHTTQHTTYHHIVHNRPNNGHHAVPNNHNIPNNNHRYFYNNRNNQPSGYGHHVYHNLKFWR